MIDDVATRLRDGDLYAVLELATRDELEPLVAVIVSKKWNGLEGQPEYRRYVPDHTRYVGLIGDELRRYGGHTVANRFRGGEGPPYSELVDDVCWKVSVPCEKGRTMANEGNLLDTFLERRWGSMTAAERERLATAGRDTALLRSSGGTWSASAGTPAVFSGPVGDVLSFQYGLGLMRSNYGVTVPCVLHVALLRRLFIEEGRGDAPIDAAAATCGTPDERRPLEEGRVEITDADGGSLLRMRPVAEPPAGSWRGLDGAGDALSGLNAMFGQVLAVGTALELGGATGARYMEVVCEGPLMKAANGGGFLGMWRGADGRIAGHANLLPTDRLSMLANASALMNLASFALSQKHLADIGAELAVLKRDVGRIADFQQGDRRSKITGAIAYLDQIAPAILDGSHTDGMLLRLEGLEADMLQLQHHLLDDLDGAIVALRKADDAGWVNSDDFMAEIERRQAEIAALFDQSTLCVRARALAWQLLARHLGDRASARRRDDVLATIGRLRERGEAANQAFAGLRGKLGKASSLLWPTAMNGRKLEVYRGGERSAAALTAGLRDVEQGIAAIEAGSSALERPFRMILRVEDGAITAVQALEELPGR